MATRSPAVKAKTAPKTKSAPKTVAKAVPKAALKPAAKAAPKAAAKAPRPRMSFQEAMRELESAGSEQTRKTYRRHGGLDPMFGVSFATFKTLVKRIGVDHELALALWKTGNFDARILASKIADPARFSPAELDAWVRESPSGRMCGSYVAMLTSEGPHAAAKAERWLKSKDGRERCTGWMLLGQMSQRDESLPDAYFEKRVAEIESSIHDAPNAEREAMNGTLILIGCRSPALRKSATAAARRIGTVEVDHGDTECKTPDAAASIEKAWAHSTSKGFASPAAHERSRELIRLRC